MLLSATFLFESPKLYFPFVRPFIGSQFLLSLMKICILIFISKSCILRVPAITNEVYTLVHFSWFLLCVPFLSVSSHTTSFYFFLKFNQLPLVILKRITASYSRTRQTISQYAKHTRESPDLQLYSQLHLITTHPPISRRRYRG